MVGFPCPVPRPALLAAALALLASSCSVTVSRNDLDMLLRAYEVRTAVMEPRFTVMSAFGAERTADVVDAFREDLPRVEALYGVEVGRRLQVHLLPMMEAEVVESAEGYLFRLGDRPGYQAYTDHVDRIVVLLHPDLELPDGRVVFAAHDRVDYRDSLRHELAHICSHLVADELPTWLDEGLAHHVGRTRWVDERPVRPNRLALLPSDRAVPLAELLDWREDGAAVVAGEAASRADLRRLALAFVTYLLEREPRPDLASALREIADTPRAGLLAREDDFRAWLDRR